MAQVHELRPKTPDSEKITVNLASQAPPASEPFPSLAFIDCRAQRQTRRPFSRRAISSPASMFQRARGRGAHCISRSVIGSPMSLPSLPPRWR